MNTKAEVIASPTSCLNRALDDEPIFVLRAHDPNAYKLVVQWAAMYAQSKGGWDHMTEAQRTKFQDAMHVGEAMRKWRDANYDVAF